MAKNYGVNVSGYYDPEGRNWETAVYQASKPILDKEFNLHQDLNQEAARKHRTGVASGWLSEGVITSSLPTDLFTASAGLNEYKFSAQMALVNDWKILVRNTNTSTLENLISLGASSGGSGFKRTDFVFLEVWRRLISASPAVDGKSAAGRIWRNGNVKIAPADDVALNYADDILDGVVGFETTKRVQIQYRLRVRQGVNIDLYPQGLGDPVVVAHTVPASAAAPDGVATAFAYVNQSAAGDPGLWVAGDGNPANGLGTVDGYMYAIPVSVIFRRNTNAFNKATNMNGAGASPAASGRPDGFHHNIIQARDVMDVRNHVSPSGWDLQELLSKNTNYLFDNVAQMEQQTDVAAGGQVGHTILKLDKIDETVTPKIRRFDNVCRHFGDRPSIETAWIKFTPTDQSGGGPNWTAGNTLTLSPSLNFRIYPYTTYAALSIRLPDQFSVIDIKSSVYVWNGTSTRRATRFYGHFDDYRGPTGVVFSQNYLAVNISDLSEITQGNLQLTLASGITPAFSNYDLYIQLVIAYPGASDTTGGGLTSTPTADFGASSFVAVTPPPATTPHLYQAMDTQQFDAPHREVRLTYRTLSQTFTQCFTNFDGVPVNKGLATSNSSVLFCPDRIATLTSITNTTASRVYTGPASITDDGHYIHIENTAPNWSGGPAAALDDAIDIVFEAVRPISAGSRYEVWYEARAPQTLRSALLGTTLQVIPRYFCPTMYALSIGSGSQNEAYPFPQQYVQSPGVYNTSGGPAFTGDHELDGMGDLVVSNFHTDAGFLQLPVMIPAVPEPQNLILNRDPGDTDAEGRSFFKAVPAGYIPTVFAPPLTDAKRHKNIVPAICELAADGPIGPKGTLVLVMFSRWASFDRLNSTSFDPDLALNTGTASIYRLKGNPLSHRRG
jgi:hypothetical protein